MNGAIWVQISCWFIGRYLFQKKNNSHKNKFVADWNISHMTQIEHQKYYHDTGFFILYVLVYGLLDVSPNNSQGRESSL
jgi:hypothetical protein